jgi:hypothetical protein
VALDAITFTTVTTSDDVREIFELQAENPPSALRAEAVAEQGFVNVRHDLPVLQGMNDDGRRVARHRAGLLHLTIDSGRSSPSAYPANFMRRESKCSTTQGGAG